MGGKMIPKNPPKFKLKDRVIPIPEGDREGFSNGYIIGIITLDPYWKEGEEPEWIYWAYDDWTGEIRPGFAEKYLEYYTGE